jgi:hypothetical protein
MGKFKVGDRVTSGGKHHATVVGVTDTIKIQWDEVDGDGIIFGTWQSDAFELIPRKFKPGDFVRSVADDNTFGTVGMVYEDDGDPEDQDPYWVALYDVEQSEEPFSADELIPWVPKIGERVIEAGVDDEEEGTVLNEDFGRAIVLWDSFPHAQDWPVTDLEPVDEHDFVAGDVVEYSHPVFANIERATVVGAGDGYLNVVFDSGFLPPGNYTKDVFKLAA